MDQLTETAAAQPAWSYLVQGGPVLWLIALVSVITLALILAILARFGTARTWATGTVEQALRTWEAGDREAARRGLAADRSVLARFAGAAMTFRTDPTLDEASAQARTEHAARQQLSDLRAGLRALEVIALVAPLLGLLGTVLGMIDAFQQLQGAGGRADPSLLAGGIWEALLTTAAGMAVAIPATLAESGFLGAVDRLQLRMEGAATRIFASGPAA